MKKKISTRGTGLSLGVWEQLNNLGSNSLEFKEIRTEAGRNGYFLSSKKWIEATAAIGQHVNSSSKSWGRNHD